MKPSTKEPSRVRSRRRLLDRAGWAYVAVCAVVAAVAIFPSEPSITAFYGLVLITLPIGVVAATITYFGSLLLGPDSDGVVVRTAFFVCWVLLVVAQMLAVRAGLGELRGRHSEPRDSRESS